MNPIHRLQSEGNSLWRPARDGLIPAQSAQESPPLFLSSVIWASEPASLVDPCSFSPADDHSNEQTRMYHTAGISRVSVEIGQLVGEDS
jgi:hypothetical protein